MDLEHNNALGIFPDLQHTELALSQLKASGFPMDKVSVVVEHLKPEDSTLGELTEPMEQSKDQFSRDRTFKRIEIGAIEAGALGGVVGGLVAGISTLALPVVGSVGSAVLLVGMATGVFYGSVSGALLGGAIGNNITQQQAQHYSDLLMQGNYLVAIAGTKEEINQAESILKSANIQDWMIFATL
jgi:hypothetical protein